jgi:hypothetical protein
MRRVDMALTDVTSPGRTSARIRTVSGQPLVELQPARSVLKPQRRRCVRQLGLARHGQIGGQNLAVQLDRKRRAGQLPDLSASRPGAISALP